MTHPNAPPRLTTDFQPPHLVSTPTSSPKLLPMVAFKRKYLDLHPATPVDQVFGQPHTPTGQNSCFWGSRNSTPDPGARKTSRRNGLLLLAHDDVGVFTFEDRPMGYPLNRANLAALIALLIVEQPRHTLLLLQLLGQFYLITFLPLLDAVLIQQYTATVDDPTTTPFHGQVPPSGLVSKVAQQVAHDVVAEPEDTFPRFFTPAEDEAKVAELHSNPPLLLALIRKRLVDVCTAGVESEFPVSTVIQLSGDPIPAGLRLPTLNDSGYNLLRQNLYVRPASSGERPLTRNHSNASWLHVGLFNRLGNHPLQELLAPPNNPYGTPVQGYGHDGRHDLVSSINLIPLHMHLPVRVGNATLGSSIHDITPLLLAKGLFDSGRFGLDLEGLSRPSTADDDLDMDVGSQATQPDTDDPFNLLLPPETPDRPHFGQALETLNSPLHTGLLRQPLVRSRSIKAALPDLFDSERANQRKRDSLKLKRGMK